MNVLKGRKVSQRQSRNVWTPPASRLTVTHLYSCIVMQGGRLHHKRLQVFLETNAETLTERCRGRSFQEQHWQLHCACRSWSDHSDTHSFHTALKNRKRASIINPQSKSFIVLIRFHVWPGRLSGAWLWPDVSPAITYCQSAEEEPYRSWNVLNIQLDSLISSCFKRTGLMKLN